MLLTLSISQFVIVDQVEIDFSPGFTVLTGETGAGKSILIDALDLLLGGRADSAVVRDGASKADLCARIAIEKNRAVQQWLGEAGLECVEEGELLLRRAVEASGKSRAWINGQPATLAQLKELGEQLIDIHGQHAHQALLRPNAQRLLLDEHARLTEDAKQVAAAWRERQRLAQLLEASEKQAAELQAQRDQLQWKYEELSSLKLMPGEWEALSEEHKRLSHAAELIQTAQSSLDAIEEQESSLLENLQKISQRIASLVEKDQRLAQPSELVESAAIQLQESADSLRKYLDRADLDPDRLAEVEQRIESIFNVSRKLRAKPEALGEMLEETREALAKSMEAADTAKLKKALAAADETFQNLAKQLTKARQSACKSLSKLVNERLSQLAMSGMIFEACAEPRKEPAAHGFEDIVFTLRNHANATPYPLSKVASGGELARISLAISVVTTSSSQIPTLIFDEVDSGIGGNVAHTVGQLLRELGKTRQVLCVTHLPQVAARGHQHLRVSKKSAAKSAPVSELAALDYDTRVTEIARMLGDEGAKQTSREHAKSLLALD
jgi:DNA repair protein RecN (Recombination protein N)